MERHQVLNCPKKYSSLMERLIPCKNGVYPKEDEDIRVMYTMSRGEINLRLSVLEVTCWSSSDLVKLFTPDFELSSSQVIVFFPVKPPRTFHFYGLCYVDNVD